MNKKTLRVGLISDTHMPRRWRTLPQSVFDLFEGVDLILHAGDVGKLWVLNQLSAIAPVIAVHGNDEEDEAVAALPYLQTVVLNRHRLVMCHSHYPDRQEELDSRKDGSLRPKFKRIAKMAKDHGAEIMFFGHWHLPMLVEIDGVLLVNAGAIAAGNYMTRQRIQTVAILELYNGQEPAITHYDLATKQVHIPHTSPDGQFTDVMLDYYDFIVDDTILQNREFILNNIPSMSGDELHIDLLLPLAEQCWYEGKDKISAMDFLNAIADHPAFSAELVNQFRLQLLGTPVNE